jgi:hypothetical protein
MSFFKENLERIKQALHIKSVMRERETLRGLRGELFMKGYEAGELVYEYHKSNIIVNTASILIARLLKDNKEPNAGISYMGVGSGNGEWDPFDPPAPTTSQTRLENEFYRKAIDLATFVQPETGEPTTVNTNIVDYSTTFGEGEAVGPWLEMGMFGGDATSELGSGNMVNWRTFPVVNKTSTMAMTIIFRITS